MHETNRKEFKRNLTDDLEQEVVAFLNYREGGRIYLGISDDGRPIGVPDFDAVQLNIKTGCGTRFCLHVWDYLT